MVLCNLPAANNVSAYFARLQQPQPSQRHGLSQPHTGAHWQPPLASALQAQALLLQLLQVHPLVEFLDMVLALLFPSNISSLTCADAATHSALHSKSDDPQRDERSRAQ
jgi:hypothetical protein